MRFYGAILDNNAYVISEDQMSQIDLSKYSAVYSLESHDALGAAIELDDFITSTSMLINVQFIIHKISKVRKDGSVRDEKTIYPV